MYCHLSQGLRILSVPRSMLGGCRHELFLNPLKDPWLKRPWPSRASYSFSILNTLSCSVHFKYEGFFFPQKPIVLTGTFSFHEAHVHKLLITAWCFANPHLSPKEETKLPWSSRADFTTRMIRRGRRHLGNLQRAGAGCVLDSLSP